MRSDEGLLSSVYIDIYIFILQNVMTFLTFIRLVFPICMRKYGIDFLHRFINYHTQGLINITSCIYFDVYFNRENLDMNEES
jgi:hypothetical protein